MRKLDEASKRLFVGRVIADTLRIAKPKLAALLDLHSVEALPTEYIGSAGTGGRPGKRLADSAFRVDFKEGVFPPDTSAETPGEGRRPFLIAACEFQHASDADMLHRVREYAAWQDEHYRHQGLIRPREHPPLLPLVFHTGPDRWTAKDGLEVYRSLPNAAASELAPFQRQAYILLEVGRRSTLSPPDGNSLGAVVRLTGCATAEDLYRRLFEEWRRFGAAADKPFRHGMREWTQEIMLGFGERCIELPSFEELEGAMEEGTMEYVLEEHVKELRRENMERGRKQGMAQGRRQGMEQGRRQGMVQGYREALEIMATQRFGADAGRRMAAAANGSLSRRRMGELSDLIVRSRTAEELVERLGG